MSIQTEIDRLKSNVSDSYAAVAEKGGTVPEIANSDNLPDAIRGIKSGGIELAKIEITSPPLKTAYRPGETFSSAGMSVKATYSNGATATATGWSFVPSGPLEETDTFVTVQYTEQGVTKTAQQPITVTPEQVAVPTQSGTLTYTGEEQSPTWSGYDSDKMTLGGVTAGTDAGSYNAEFTVKYGYCWPDGSKGVKMAPWTIGKAAGSLSLDKTSVTLDPDHRSATVTVTRAGDGEISVSSDNTSVATVSLSGNTITISAVDENSGSTTVTVQVSEGANYNAPADKTVNVKASFLAIYGASWDGTSTTKWTRTDDAAGFVDPVPYVAGASSYGSPFDDLQPWAGMVKSERTGGAVVAIPKFWYKLTQNGAGMKIQIADGPAEGFSVSPTHMDRNDGKGERDVVYIGRYHCASDYMSKTGVKPKASITRSAARSGIHNLGSTIWQNDFATRFTLWLLYIVEFADWNSQKTIGKGCGNNSATQNMGYTDSMPYHTGTTLSSRDTYGLGTQYHNIEGLWDNVYDWCDGCYNSSSGLNIILNPNSFSDSSGGTSAGTPTSGWPSAFGVKTAGYKLFIPTATGGNETTYSCDYWNFYASHPCVYVGGDYHQGGGRGLFYVSYNSASNSNANIGSRLLELP